MDRSASLANKAKTAKLESEEDLLRDQLNFFRASNALPNELQQDDGDVNQLAASLAQLNASANSAKSSEPAVLDSVAERKPRRRTRRRHRPQRASEVGFPRSDPQSTAKFDLGRSQSVDRSAPGTANVGSSHESTSGIIPESISTEARETFSSMSADEIAAAREEIFSSLKPESVQFLRDRWRERHAAAPTTALSSGNSATETQISQPLSVKQREPGKNIHYKSEEPSHERERVLIEPVHPETADEGKYVGVEHPPSPLRMSEHANTHDTEKQNAECLKIEGQASAREFDSQHLLSEVLVSKADASNEEELAKRAWMKSVDAPLETQHEVDELLSQAIESMGEFGKRRFDFDGAALSEEQIKSLPTHLGLHHHGAAPGDAGYTLADILLLMRSTVVTQRILALKMMASTTKRHGQELIDALTKSGGLALIFARFPSISAIQTSVSNQLAYLEAVEGFVQHEADSWKCESAPDLYFASRFYSPSPSRKCKQQSVDVLCESECLPILCQIASGSLRVLGSSITSRALSLIQVMTFHHDRACAVILRSERALRALQNVACNMRVANARAAFTSCNILATIAVSEGWKGGDTLSHLKGTALSDRFLRNLSNHLMLLMSDDLRVFSERERLVSRGVLVVFRAALAFEHGIQIASVCAQSVSRLMLEEGETGTTAYLVAEAFAHSLYLTLSNRQSNGDSDLLREGDAQRDAENFAKDQLSSLLPIGLTSARAFSNLREDEFDARGGALGHFAATLVVTTSVSIDNEDYYVRLFNVCSRCSTLMRAVMVQPNPDIARLQTLSSVSHAAARLLRIELDAAFVARELEVLMQAAKLERNMLPTHWRESGKYPIAHSCAEWICLLARSSKCQQAAEAALDILDYVEDVRVTIDMLSRALFNVRFLRHVNPALTAEKADSCVRDVLTTLTDALSGMQTTNDRGTDDRETNPFSSVRSLLVHIMSSVNEPGSALVLFSTLRQLSNVSDSVIFEAMLHGSKNLYTEAYFAALSYCGRSCVKRGENLIAIDPPAPLLQDVRCVNTTIWSKTALSTVSTKHDPILAKSILTLSSHLVERGPQGSSSSAVHDITKDNLESLILNLIYSDDVDRSLRRELWKQTITECGSAVLFEHAMLWLPPLRYSERNEHYHILDLIGQSVLGDNLGGESCPVSVKLLIVASLAKEIRHEDGYVWDVLLPVGTREQRARFVMKLKMYVNVHVGQQNYLASDLGIIKTWMSNQESNCNP